MNASAIAATANVDRMTPPTAIIYNGFHLGYPYAMDAVALPTGILGLIGRLVLATTLGALVGLNREMQRKPAGLRTHALVALGAAVFTLAGLLLGSSEGANAASASRVIQGLIAGIGFIGGGVILHRDDVKGVHGLTTAAAIWVVAGAGIATGLGLWRIGVTSVVLTLIVLVVGERIDESLGKGDARK